MGGLVDGLRQLNVDMGVRQIRINLFVNQNWVSNLERKNQYNRWYRRAKHESDPDAARAGYRDKQARWRARNPVKRREYDAAQAPNKRARHRALLMASKAKPCLDCGNKFPVVCMDFDHRDPATKNPRLLTGMGVMQLTHAEIREELPKCDLVCANCHRIRTARRKNSPTGEPWW
jgi:hypothetical protein